VLHHALTYFYLHSNLSDQDVIHLHITLQEKADLMEEVLTEVSVYLGMLYHLIEAFKGHDDFADELSTFNVFHSILAAVPNVILVSLDPPLPVYLFTVVAGLKEKSAKGYPIKKVSYLLSLLHVSFDNLAASPSFMENFIDVLGWNTRSRSCQETCPRTSGTTTSVRRM